MPLATAWRQILLGAIAVYAIAAIISYYRGSQPGKLTKVSIDSSIPKYVASNESSICSSLANALADSVYSEQHQTYHESVNSYWSLNACELTPACVVRPANISEVAVAIKILRNAYDGTAGSSTQLKFAVRSGGHSPEAGFASIDGDVIIDMSQLNDVAVAEDRQTVTIGVGARWLDVYTRLDAMGLGVVGGRNSHVGVGGLVLGGGISFFSPRFGMVCDNIEEYEIVLADGNIVRATPSQHEHLWRALKGGTGNFGVVTRITAKTFVSGDIWAGYAYWTGWQTKTAIAAFFDFNKPENFDEFAAGPIMAISYVQQLGVSLVVNSFVYTKPERWPPVFKRFKSMWRLWDTTKVQSFSGFTREMNAYAPSGQRQYQITMTVTNDLDTLYGLNEIFAKKLQDIKRVRGSVWALVLQTLSASVTRKGSPNVLGFETRPGRDNLVIVLLCISWLDARDDELVHRVADEIMRLGEEYARQRGTLDPYVYLNYAASGQDPIAGYGSENKRFLQEMSRKYDPDGFFQNAKQGGFKLDLY